MPAINKEWYPTTELYNSIQKDSAKVNERNDCTIVAITVATDRPYIEVKAALEAAGKYRHKGCRQQIQIKALKALGFKAQEVHPQFFIDQYPEVHKRQLKNVTTHQPDRFPYVFRDGKTYLLYTPSHVTAMINGRVHDWTRGCRKKVVGIFEITPIKENWPK